MKKTSIIIHCALALSLITGCGSGGEKSSSSQSSASSAENTTAFSLGGGQTGFTVPEQDAAFIKAPATAVLNRELSEAQSLLSAGNALYPLRNLVDYQNLLPHPELFCNASTNAEFLNIAEQLGGFRKGSSIRIEKDATAPQVQSGLMIDNLIVGQPDSASGGGGGGNVTIQRPDIVGTSGSKAFYLSNTYGLVTVDYASLPFEQPTPSCAFAMPGSPQNFVITDTHLYAIISSANRVSSAVLQFDISGQQPVYVSGMLFENQNIIDARLFNDTLALYLRIYEVEDSIPQSDTNADPVAGGGASYHPYPTYNTLGYELKTLQTAPDLSELSRDVLVGEGVENPPLDSQDAIENVHRYSSFNSFLSASGEYLVVTESVNERHFERYEQRSYYRCNEYERHEYPYTSCRTIWKRVENPDYVEPQSPGVLECGSDLASCLSTRLPTVNRYIFVDDGQQCEERTRYRHTCLSGETVTYDRPIFSYQSKTKFTVFHFEGDRFVRLDDQLASLEDGDIVVQDRPFEIPGRVQKHDHIQFHEDYLYVISGGDWAEKQSQLTTLAIMGNSAMEVSTLPLTFDAGEINAAFADDRIYISTRSGGTSEITTLSLADPLYPTSQNRLSFASGLEQLIYTQDGFVGIGQVAIFQNDRSYRIGNVSAFAENGEENDNLLLGADYRYYSSPLNYDDQVVSFNALWQRLIMPYNVSWPLAGTDGPRQANRLSIISTAGGQVNHEATFDLPQGVDRSAQLDDQNALAFSADFIHHLKQSDGWQKTTVFDGAIPQSIYYSRQYPTQVQYYELGNEIQFRLIDSPEKASGEILDTQTVQRSGSNVCLNEQILFDRDRVLVVREKPGQYISYQDCPADRRRDTEKEFIGYRIGEDSLDPITDLDELTQLYIQAGWNLVCLTDSEELGGEILEGYTIDDVGDLTCYTFDQYIDHAYSVLEDLGTGGVAVPAQ